MTGSLPIFWYMLRRVYGASERHKRHIGIGASLLIYVLMSWWIWVPAEVDGKITYHKGDFAIDSDVYGIKWKKDYSEIALDLPNAGDNDLTDVNAYLWVDAQIVEAGIAKGINACTYEVYPIAFIGAPILSVTNIEGLSEIPLAQDKWTSPKWHIRCERLNRKSQIEMVFAITPKVVPGNLPSQLHPGEKAKPSWAKLWISLLAGYRQVSWSIEECFVVRCDDIPETPSGEPSLWSRFLMPRAVMPTFP